MAGIDDLNTPCYIYDKEELIKNLDGFKRAMESAWEFGPVSMGISVKTAPIAGVLAVARTSGYLAEVVSDEEYELALMSGFNPGQVIFNGPIKSKAWMFFAFDSGAIVNVDSWRELRFAVEYAAENRAPRLGIRVNFDLEAACPGETCAGDEPARFGFCVEDGSLGRAIALLRAAGIEPVGLHMHSSTESHSTSVYRALCREAVRLVSEYSLASLEYVDVGGGFYGGGANEGAYTAYANVIAEGLSPLAESGVRVILEPGGAVLATAGSLAGRVVDTKTVRGFRFVITELSKLDLNSTLFSRRSFKCEAYVSGQREVCSSQTICGYTCMEMDRVVDVEGWPQLEEGDLILVRNAGAYAASFAPGFFIKQMPSVYLRNSDGSYEALELRRSLEPPSTCCVGSNCLDDD